MNHRDDAEGVARWTDWIWRNGAPPVNGGMTTIRSPGVVIGLAPQWSPLEEGGTMGQAHMQPPRTRAAQWSPPTKSGITTHRP
jgi:hypothetical protein